MDITSATYGKDSQGENMSVIVVSNGVTLFVPLDSANADYQAIQEWVADGGVIEE